MKAQNTDCVTAQIICSDGSFDFTPNGSGIDDFANPNNDASCLLTFEDQSAWYYFEFRTDMPLNSVLEFTITPDALASGDSPDYDFAIYGPNLGCDSLGSPLRCSFAFADCDFCPLTGLGRGAEDFSEGPYSDGFLAPMVVQPGEGFYMLLNNFRAERGGFSIDWGGSAAPFLNCNANPFCNNASVTVGRDLEICAGSPSFRLNSTANGFTPNTTVEWIGTPEALSFLDDVNALSPNITIPIDYAGTLQYVLSVNDGACTLADGLEINVLPSTPVQISGDATICPGESSILDAGPGYASYRWSSMSIEQSITVTTPGNYTVTVTNEENCPRTASFRVRAADPPTPAISGPNTVCTGDVITLDAGADYKTYRWSTGATTPTISVDAGGTFRVTVTNTNDCEGIAEITVNEVAKSIPKIIGDSLFCFGESVVLTLNQTYPNITWSNMATSASITASESGIYGVTITDANGCQNTDEIEIFEKSPIDATISGDRAYCETSSTRLEVPPGFTYQWSTNDTTAAILVDNPGNYQVTLTDSDGCEAILSVPITENPLPNPTVQGGEGICADSTIILETNNIYDRYLWSTGETTPSIEIDVPGIYTLEVETAEGCANTVSIDVPLFPMVQPEIITDTIFCQETGASLSITENFAAYLWSTGETTSTIDVTESGNYGVTVTDANGCNGTTAATLQALDISFPTTQDTLSVCPNTSISLEVETGFSTYDWSTGADTNVIEVDEGGIYAVTVTNDIGCEASKNFVVQETTPSAVLISGPTKLCAGDTITLRATLGFAAYQWSNDLTTDSIQITNPGVYSITATATNDCTVSTSFTVDGFFTNPTPTIEQPDFICENEIASIRVVENFVQYDWFDGTNGQEIQIDRGGIFSVQVVDENGCRGDTTFEITERNAPLVEIIGDTLYCAGSTARLSAMQSFVRYLWSTGDTTDAIVTGLPGIYSLTVSDGACEASTAIEVQEIVLPLADPGSDKTLDCNITSATLGVSSNGNNGYGYRWEGPGIDSANANDSNPIVTEAGDYQLVIIDQILGCESERAQVTVSDKAYEPKIILQTNGLLSCQSSSIVIDASESIMGEKINFRWYDPQGRLLSNSNADRIIVTEPGFYTLRIEDTQLGCKAVDSVEIKASFDFPMASAGADQLLTCKNNSVILDGSASSDGLDFSHRWTSISGNIVADNVTLSPTINRPGTYILTVENKSNNCISRDTVRVLEDRTPPNADAGLTQRLDCTISEVTLTGSGSSANGLVNLAWRMAENNEVIDSMNSAINVSSAGTYILEVTSVQNGCVATDSVRVIDISNPPRAVQTTLSNPLCFNDRNGSIHIDTVVGGTGPYFFSLNGEPLAFVNEFKGLAAGTYQMMVEDVAGCRYETDFVLEEGFLLQVDLGEDKYLKITEKAFLSPAVNMPRREIIELNWIEGLKLSCYDDCWEQKVEPWETTKYAVTVENRQGCRAMDELIIYVNNSEDVFIPNAFSPNNDGHNDKFMIYGGGAVAKIREFRIVDRWGNQVFEASNFQPNDAAFGWDGRANGTMKDPSVFAYFAEIEYVNGATKFFKGDVTLLR